MNIPESFYCAFEQESLVLGRAEKIIWKTRYKFGASSKCIKEQGIALLVSELVCVPIYSNTEKMKRIEQNCLNL